MFLTELFLHQPPSSCSCTLPCHKTPNKVFLSTTNYTITISPPRLLSSSHTVRQRPCPSCCTPKSHSLTWLSASIYPVSSHAQDEAAVPPSRDKERALAPRMETRCKRTMPCFSFSFFNVAKMYRLPQSVHLRSHYFEGNHCIFAGIYICKKMYYDCGSSGVHKFQLRGPN